MTKDFCQGVINEYDLVLASRGDTRRLWGEHFVDLEQPRKSAELWAIREALTCFMTAFLAQAPEKEVKPLDMRTCGVGSLNPRYAELVREALEAERTVVNSKWWYRGIEVDVPVLRGIKPNHVIANTLNYFPEYRGEMLDGAAVIDSLRLESILSYRLPKEALKEAGISALVKAQYPSLRLEDKTRATLTFGECVPALNGNKADLDHLIDATQGVLNDSLTPPENGVYYAPLDVGLGPLEAAVNAVSRNGFDRLVYKELMAGRDLDPRRLNHEFFGARIEGYDRVQVRVVDSLPIDAYAESEPHITGMGLGLPKSAESITVIQKCMLWLLMSKNQVIAILRKAPAKTMVHNGPGRPSRTLSNRLTRNSAIVLCLNRIRLAARIRNRPNRSDATGWIEVGQFQEFSRSTPHRCRAHGQRLAGPKLTELLW